MTDDDSGRATLTASASLHLRAAARLYAQPVSRDDRLAHHARIQTELLWYLAKSTNRLGYEADVAGHQAAERN